MPCDRTVLGRWWCLGSITVCRDHRPEWGLSPSEAFTRGAWLCVHFLLFDFRRVQGLRRPRKYRPGVSQWQLQALGTEGTPRVGTRQTRPGPQPRVHSSAFRAVSAPPTRAWSGRAAGHSTLLGRPRRRRGHRALYSFPGLPQHIFPNLGLKEGGTVCLPDVEARSLDPGVRCGVGGPASSEALGTGPSRPCSHLICGGQLSWVLLGVGAHQSVPASSPWVCLLMTLSGHWT